jgi:glutamate-1-semialdehyde 2,1-aminomutase
MSLGTPRWLADYTLVVPFNDLTVLERLLEERGHEIACLILEPVMMNIGIAQPEPGYLQGLKDLLHRPGAELIFDEVKTGSAVAYGGAGDRYGVRPDLTCLAKATFGGTPGAAFGGDADVMATIHRGAAQQGTFNGNPLVAAAGLATLREVLVPAAYERLAELGTRLASGCAAAVAQHGIPAHTVDLGAKGCVSYRPEPLRNYRDFLDTNLSLYAASYPWMINRGIFMTPGDEEQWTISVQHTEAEIDHYVEAFADLCAELTR